MKNTWLDLDKQNKQKREKPKFESIDDIEFEVDDMGTVVVTTPFPYPIPISGTPLPD